MSINIGQKIKEKATEKRLSQEAIGERINTTKQNVGNIYKRASIDTQLLLKLCEVLEFNFFELYYTQEPLKSMRDKEIDALNKQIKELQQEVKQRDQRIEDLEEKNADKKKLINAFEEKIAVFEEERALYKKNDSR